MLKYILIRAIFLRSCYVGTIFTKKSLVPRLAFCGSISTTHKAYLVISTLEQFFKSPSSLATTAINSTKKKTKIPSVQDVQELICLMIGLHDHKVCKPMTYLSLELSAIFTVQTCFHEKYSDSNELNAITAFLVRVII